MCLLPLRRCAEERLQAHTAVWSITAAVGITQCFAGRAAALLKELSLLRRETLQYKETGSYKKWEITTRTPFLKACSRDTGSFWKVFPVVFLITLIFGVRMRTLLSCNNIRNVPDYKPSIVKLLFSYFPNKILWHCRSVFILSIVAEIS